MNLNIDPYYDDYDHKKGFHKILFKPGVAVQARELTQIQSILQNQVTKFADHIFEDGSVVDGAAHTIDFNVTYFKIAESFNNGAIVFDNDIIGKYLIVNSEDTVNPDNRKYLIKAVTQKTDTDPKTIYATLISGGSSASASKYVSNNVRLDVYSVPNPVIGTTSIFRSFSSEATGDSVSGNSVLFGIDEGVFYTKNSFVYCPSQTIVVSKYVNRLYTGTITASTSSANITGVGTLFTTELSVGDDIFTIDNKLIGTVLSIADNTNLVLKNNANTLVTDATNFTVSLSTVIGLKAIESIITADSDATLLDPSFGSYNYAAPGADRYFISLEATAVTYQEQSLSSEDFIDICHIKDGVVQSDQRLPIYSNLEDIFARRTYDESGDYIVNGLLPTVKANPEETLLTLNVAAGKAYVKGYEIEKNGVSSIELTKPRTFASTTDYTVATQYGNYVTVSSITGSLPDITSSSSVNLYSSTGAIIGTARVINLIPVSYGEYQLYLDDVSLTSDSFSSVISIGEKTGEFIATLTSAKISDTANRLLVFPIPLGNIKTVSSISYETKKLFKFVPVYGGVCSLTSDSLTKDFVPSSGTSNNINYTIALLSLSSGNGYTVNSVLDLSTVDITVSTNPDTNSSISFDFNDASFNGVVDIIATINMSGQAVRTKTLVSNYGKKVTFVEDSAAAQSLGVSDIHKFTGAYEIGSKIYAGTYDPLVTYASNSVVMHNGKLYDISGTTLGTTALDNIGSTFQIDNGQTDSYYGNGFISRKTAFTTTTSILAVFDYYVHSGEGPLVVNNTIAVSYSNIGNYYDSVSFSTYKLRNCLDFRPVQQENGAVFDTFILPFSNAILDVDYYLGRIDKLSLDKTGKYQIIQGIPARQPIHPASNPDAMDICSITYDAYTDDEKSTKISLVKNKRYTMKDIGALEGRIENVEYYTSLSMLEKDTSSKTFTDDNGTPLFNNGFLVDSFQGKNVADVTNPDMQTEIDYDKNELRPKFFTKTAHANLATTGTGINSNTITLPYTSTKLTGVNSYSTTVSVNPYNVTTASGSATLKPDTDHWVKELLPVNDADTIKQLAGTSDLVPVTVWNAWDPKSGATLSTSAITSADADFIDIATSKNKIVSGTTYNFSKNIIPVTRERVIQYKVTNMLANTKLYYFFGKELQEDGFVTNLTGSVFLTTPPTTDDSGNATGYIVIPQGKEGSTFVITFSNSPAGKEYASSYVSVNYYVDMSAKYADTKPISVVTGDQVGDAVVTELKVPKPTATYTIEPSSYVVSEGEYFTFTFNAINYDLKGDFTGAVVVTDGTATFDSKTINGTTISSLTSFTFAVDSSGKAVVKLKVTDDGISQAARKITLTVTPHNKSSRDITKYPEFLYGSSLSSAVKLLNPVKTAYSVSGPVSVGTTDTINVSFQSDNAESDVPISYKVYKKIGNAAEVNITSSFTTANPFNTSNANPTHVLTRSVSADDVAGETVYKDKNGQYRYVFTDASGNSKEHVVKIIGNFDTKYYKLSNNAFSSNVSQGSRISFALETNHYTTNASSDTIPFVITANDVDITTLTGYTLSPVITSFTGTTLTVSVVVSNSLVLTAPKTLKLELTGTNKGKGVNSICYIQNNEESTTISADKSANSSITDAGTINFSVTSSYGAAAAGTKITEIKVSNLAANEYTLNKTSGVLDGTGTLTFSFTAVSNRLATTDKTFNVSLLYNGKNTLTSNNFNLTKSVQPTLSASFRNSTNTADLTTINPTSTSGTASSAKLLINQSNFPTSEIFSINITPNPVPSASGVYVFTGNTNTFSKTMTSAELLAVSNLVDVGFSLGVPSNITLNAEIKPTSRNLSAKDSLLLNNATRAFKITKDGSTIDVGKTVNYTVTILNENAVRNVTWSIAFADANSISDYFSTYSGTGSIAVGGSLSIPITRNSKGIASSKQIVLTVTDSSSTVASVSNSEVSLSAVSAPTANINFYDATETKINAIELPDSIKPYRIRVEIDDPNLNKDDTVTFDITSTGNTLGLIAEVDPVQSIRVVGKVDSSKKISKEIWVKKNTATTTTGNIINVKITSATISTVLTTLSKSQDLSVSTKPVVPISLSIYRNGKAKTENAFSVIVGTTSDIAVDTSVVLIGSDKLYLAITPVSGNSPNAKDLSTHGSYFTVTANGSAVSSTSKTTTNTALTAELISDAILYDVSSYTGGIFNFKINSGSVAANDKFVLTCYTIKSADTASFGKSNALTITNEARPLKKYDSSRTVDVLTNTGTSTIVFTPVNFDALDAHTLTLPLTTLVANDVVVTVNGATVTITNATTGALTGAPALTGNTPITIVVQSNSWNTGTITPKVEFTGSLDRPNASELVKINESNLRDFTFTPKTQSNIMNGANTTITFTPSNFVSGDAHTLTLPLTTLVASDVTVTVNGVTVGITPLTGVLTNCPTLSGNNNVIVVVTSNSNVVGTVKAVLTNVAANKSANTYVTTNKGIVKSYSFTPATTGSITFGGTATNSITFTPSNFVSGDAHTLTLPLTGLVASDVTVTVSVNGGTATSVTITNATTGALTGVPSLQFNNTVTINITTNSWAVGTVKAVLTNVADSTITNYTTMSTNPGITKSYSVSGNANVYYGKSETITFTPEHFLATDTHTLKLPLTTLVANDVVVKVNGTTVTITPSTGVLTGCPALSGNTAVVINITPNNFTIGTITANITSSSVTGTASMTTNAGVKAIKTYDASPAKSIYNGAASIMTLTPNEFFLPSDVHTLTLPLAGIAFSDIDVTVNETPLTDISSLGVITPPISLTGTNVVSIKVKSKTNTVGFITAKIINGDVTGSTFTDTNKGVSIESANQIYENLTYSVVVKPRAKDTSYSVGLFDYNTGSYVAISGISYTDENLNALTPVSNLLKFTQSNLGTDNVATFWYTVPTGFLSSANKNCRIRFVPSDDSGDVIYPVECQKTIVLQKSYTIENDSQSINNAKKEGDVVMFTITPTNPIITDTYDYTVVSDNGRKFKVEAVDDFTMFYPEASTHSYTGVSLAKKSYVLVRLDDNSIVDSTTEITLTVKPSNSEYATNGSPSTSKAYIVNSSKPHQTMEFFDVNGNAITQVKTGENFTVSGYNNIPSKSLTYSSDLVEYIGVSVSDITNIAVGVSTNPTLKTLTYEQPGAACHYEFKFKALSAILNIDGTYSAAFFLNRTTDGSSALNAFLSIKEEISKATISVTTKDNSIWSTNRVVKFNIDTTNIQHGENLKWSIDVPAGMQNVSSIIFNDKNNNKFWIEGMRIGQLDNQPNIEYDDGLIVVKKANLFEYSDGSKYRVSNYPAVTKVNSFQKAKDWIVELNEDADWYNDFVLPNLTEINYFAVGGKSTGDNPILASVPAWFIYYYSDAGTLHRKGSSKTFTESDVRWMDEVYALAIRRYYQ